jgi:hypothetical protein
VGSPVGVHCLYRLRTDAFGCLLHGLGVAKVEDEQRLTMRRGCAVLPAAREFELRACFRQAEEHTVVAVMIGEAAELRQAESVALEADELREALRVSREPHLHLRESFTACPVHATSPTNGAQLLVGDRQETLG